MITSTTSNGDNPFWLQETRVSTAYTTQEGIGAETLSNVSERILVDSRYAEVINNIPHSAEHRIFSSDRQITSTPDTIFLWRQYMLERPIENHVRLEGYHKEVLSPQILGIEFLNRLDNFDKMYDNHGIEGYYLT
jgi:hypothetical protein